MTAPDQETMDVQDLLKRIEEIENQYDDSAVASERKEAEKSQKKKLREIRKLVADNDIEPAEKIKRLMVKCMQEVKDNTQHQVAEVKAAKKIETLTKERSHAQAELNKSAVMQDKLQTLCRELQKQNKQVVDDSKQAVLQEHERRQEMSNKFGETVKSITARLDEHTAERQKLVEENDDLRQKLKSLLDQFDLTQKHAEQQMHAKDLEAQLAEAKLKQEQQVSKALEEKATEFLQQIQIMKATEVELKKQLDSYGSKFEEFQETLTKSNEVFTKLRSDAEKQTKQVKSLEKKLLSAEKERAKLQRKYDEVAAALLEKASEAEQLKRQKLALESLCRSLRNDDSHGDAHDSESSTKSDDSATV